MVFQEGLNPSWIGVQKYIGRVQVCFSHWIEFEVGDVTTRGLKLVFWISCLESGTAFQNLIFIRKFTTKNLDPFCSFFPPLHNAKLVCAVDNHLGWSLFKNKIRFTLPFELSALHPGTFLLKISENILEGISLLSFQIYTIAMYVVGVAVLLLFPVNKTDLFEKLVIKIYSEDYEENETCGKHQSDYDLGR